MLAVMASYLVHGLWLPVTGLGLWIEQVEGHKIVSPMPFLKAPSRRR